MIFTNQMAGHRRFVRHQPEFGDIAALHGSVKLQQAIASDLVEGAQYCKQTHLIAAQQTG
jgi:hypothetical protein